MNRRDFLTLTSASLLAGILPTTGLAGQWVKGETAHSNTVATQDAVVVLMPNGTLWAAPLHQGYLLEETPFKPALKQDGSLLSGVVEIAAGQEHVLARLKNGQLWAAGGNDHGQLGDGTRQTRARFVPCSDHTGQPVHQVAAVVAGRAHSLMLLENGSVWAAGANDHGQLGSGNREDQTHFTRCVYPDKVPVRNIIGIEAHDDYSLLLRADDFRFLAGRYPKASIVPGSKIITHPYFVEF